MDEILLLWQLNQLECSDNLKWHKKEIDGAIIKNLMDHHKK